MHGHAAQSTVASIAAADSARTSRKSRTDFFNQVDLRAGEGVQVRGEPIRYLRRPRELVQHRHRADPSGPCSEHEHLGQHGQLPGAADRADRSAGHIRRPLVVLTTACSVRLLAGPAEPGAPRGLPATPPGRVELRFARAERFPTRHFLRGLPTAALAIVDVGEDVVAKWGAPRIVARARVPSGQARSLRRGWSLRRDRPGEEDVSLCNAGCSGWTASAHRFAPLDRPRLHRAVTG